MEWFTNGSLTLIGTLWIVVHVLGLVAAWMVRMHSGGRLESLMQGSFFTCLVAVSLTTVVGQFCCLAMWPLSALTLALMIVLSVVDLGSSRSRAIGFER